MQKVELGKRNAPRPHVVHAGLVFVAPGIREAQPVGLVSERLQHCLGLARNAGAPIDERAEYIEKQRLDGGELGGGHDCRDKLGRAEASRFHIADTKRFSRADCGHVEATGTSSASRPGPTNCSPTAPTYRFAAAGACF